MTDINLTKTISSGDVLKARDLKLQQTQLKEIPPTTNTSLPNPLITPHLLRDDGNIIFGEITEEILSIPPERIHYNWDVLFLNNFNGEGDIDFVNGGSHKIFGYGPLIENQGFNNPENFTYSRYRVGDIVMVHPVADQVGATNYIIDENKPDIEFCVPNIVPPVSSFLLEVDVTDPNGVDIQTPVETIKIFLQADGQVVEMDEFNWDTSTLLTFVRFKQPFTVNPGAHIISGMIWGNLPQVFDAANPETITVEGDDIWTEETAGQPDFVLEHIGPQGGAHAWTFQLGDPLLGKAHIMAYDDRGHLIGWWDHKGANWKGIDDHDASELAEPTSTTALSQPVP